MNPKRADLDALSMLPQEGPPKVRQPSDHGTLFVGRAYPISSWPYLTPGEARRHGAPPPSPGGPGPHPALNAALYTLDVLIPVPALGQASDLDPQGLGSRWRAALHVRRWLPCHDSDRHSHPLIRQELTLELASTRAPG